jgi:hypothetical protein
MVGGVGTGVVWAGGCAWAQAVKVSAENATAVVVKKCFIALIGWRYCQNIISADAKL